MINKIYLFFKNLIDGLNPYKYKSIDLFNLGLYGKALGINTYINSSDATVIIDGFTSVSCEGMEIVTEYIVGPYTIKVCFDQKNNEYIYVAELFPKPPKSLMNDIGSKIGLILNMIPNDKIINDHDLMDIISRVLDIDHDYIEVALYLIKQILGYGKLQVLLDDVNVEDISITGSGPIWVRLSSSVISDPDVDMVKTNILLTLPEIISLQQYIANKSGYYVSQSNPIIDIQMPIKDGGHRVHIVSSTVAGSRPEIAIRKKIRRRILIKDLIECKTINNAIDRYFINIIRNNGSILIAGPPGSGKTTLLKAILYTYIPYNWKVVIIEDTPEIDPPENSSWVRYNTYELGKLNIDQFTLAKAALRASVSRVIVIGETRGSEAQVLAQALNMGMVALTTFHGGSTNEVVTRLRSPPINLAQDQIANIWAVATMGFKNVDGSRRRVLERIDEISYVDGRIKIHKIYRYEDDYDIDPDSLINRSIRLRNKGITY